VRWRRGRERARSGEGAAGPGRRIVQRLGVCRGAEHSRAGFERRTLVGLRVPTIIEPIAGEEPAELTRTVQPDEDLADQSLVPRRLAAGAEDLDSRVHDRRGGLARRERPGLDVLGRGEQPRPRDELRVAAAAFRGLERAVAARPRPGRQHAARRDELDHAADLVIRIGEPRLDESVPRADAAEHRRDEGIGTAVVEEQDHPGVLREMRRDGLEGAAKRRGLPRPRRANRGSQQRLERQQRRGIAPERPGRAVVRHPESFLAEAGRWLAEHEPDARAGVRAGRGAALAREALQRTRGHDPDDRVVRAFHEASEIRAEPRLEGTERAALESLHECSHVTIAILECEPRVALTPALRNRAPDRAAGDAE